MNKCDSCNCNCHCNVKGHSDLYGVCSCENCKCKDKEVVDVSLVLMMASASDPEDNYRHCPSVKGNVSREKFSWLSQD